MCFYCLQNDDEPINPDRLKSVSANPTAELTVIDKDKVAKMYEEQNKQCKGKFLNSPHDDLKKVMIFCLFLYSVFGWQECI